MNFVVHAPAPATVPVQGLGAGDVFPVHRIYCVGRNYVDHAIEMGHTGREAPFFFMKPADAVVPAGQGAVAQVSYPSQTQNLHHEVELVVAIGTGGRNITPENAPNHVWGYAVGLDMTRRDLQNDMKKQGRRSPSGRFKKPLKFHCMSTAPYAKKASSENSSGACQKSSPNFPRRGHWPQVTSSSLARPKASRRWWPVTP